MKEAQKIIKYCALAFAFFLIFSIISGIMYGVMSLSNLFDDKSELSFKMEDFENLENVAILNIDIKSANLVIQTGETLHVEVDNQNIKVQQSENKILIQEKKYYWNKKQANNIIVSIPRTLLFDKVSINSGAGKIEIDSIKTKELSFDLGAGNVLIQNLTVVDEAKIDSGAGELQILSGSIHDLDLDMGIGKLTLNTELNGHTKIDSGVGAIALNLIGTESDYKIKVDKGIGSIHIAGEEIKDNTDYGTGVNVIEIDGGVGSIDIFFVDEVNR